MTTLGVAVLRWCGHFGFYLETTFLGQLRSVGRKLLPLSAHLIFDPKQYFPDLSFTWHNSLCFKFQKPCRDLTLNCSLLFSKTQISVLWRKIDHGCSYWKGYTTGSEFNGSTWLILCVSFTIDVQRAGKTLLLRVSVKVFSEHSNQWTV